jgi:hypothetical protein
MHKVWMYVDGFNFHYAAKNGDMPIGLAWCDFGKLACRMLPPDGRLAGIEYFTAPVGDFSNRWGEEERQALWLRAVLTIPGLEVVEPLLRGPALREA